MNTVVFLSSFRAGGQSVDRFVAMGPIFLQRLHHDPVQASLEDGLRILDAEERALSAAIYPPGSLKHLYTPTENRAERRTAKDSTLKVEPE